MGLFPELSAQGTCHAAGEVLSWTPSVVQLVSAMLVYGYLAYAFSEIASDAAEKLAVYTSPRFVTAVLVPFVGAIPDAALTSASVLASNAKSTIVVGVGTLAGSTIFLQTVPIGLAGLASRAAFEEATAKIKAGQMPETETETETEMVAEARRQIQLARRGDVSAHQKSIATTLRRLTQRFGHVVQQREDEEEAMLRKHGDRTPRFAARTNTTLAVMFATSLIFLVVQIPDFLHASRAFERWWLGAIGVAGLLASFVYMGYLLRQTRKPETPAAAAAAPSSGLDRARRLDVLLKVAVHQDEQHSVHQAMTTQEKRNLIHKTDAPGILDIRSRRMRAVWYGTVLTVCLTVVSLVSDPFINAIDALAREVGLHPFYIAFFIAPAIGDIGEIMVAVTQAKIAFANAADSLFTGVVMMNIFVAPSFFLVMFSKHVDWVYPAETTIIIIIQFCLAAYFISSLSVNRVTGPPRWHSVFIMLLFPFSLLWIWVVDSLVGLSVP